MCLRRIFAVSLVGLAALFAEACAKRAEAPGSNAPSSAPPAEQTPASPEAPGYGTPPPGGGAPGPAGTSSQLLPKTEKEAGDAYATVADAEQALDQANGELAGLIGSGKGKDKSSSTTAPPAKAAPSSKPDTGGTQLAQGDPRCERACKAFASLRRAADGVCRLAGDGDTRCARARGIVKDNEARVAACKCDAGG